MLLSAPRRRSTFYLVVLLRVLLAVRVVDITWWVDVRDLRYVKVVLLKHAGGIVVGLGRKMSHGGSPGWLRWKNYHCARRIIA